MFETLASKTFLILAVSLGFAYIGNMLAVKMFTPLMLAGDLRTIRNRQLTAIICQLIIFFLLLFLQNKTPVNMILMAGFTLSTGFTLGLYTLRDPAAMRQAIAITALITFLTGLIATYSGLDFAWMGKFLFIALLVLIVIRIIQLFTRIEKGRRAISFFGVILFTGYLLFDFNRLAKAHGNEVYNTWETALNFAISIYLDIINLLINLFDLLSSSR